MKFYKSILIGLLSCGLMLSACSTDDSSSGDPSSGGSEAWSSITYQEIKQAYNNKQNSPYNHREYEYIENNTTYRMIEDKSGIWIIDQEKSDGEATSSPLAWFEDQYNILLYESVIDQATMNIEKNETEHKYRYIFEYQTTKHDVILDQYFNYLQFLAYHDNQLSGGMQNIVYSTVN